MYFTSQKSTWSLVSCNSHCVISFIYYLRIVFLSSFLQWSCFIAIEKSEFESIQEARWKFWLPIKWCVKVLDMCRVWHPFMQITICVVLVCVYCSDFLQISYVPCTLYVCQNLYRTSAFGLVNPKSIKLFDKVRLVRKSNSQNCSLMTFDFPFQSNWLSSMRHVDEHSLRR